MLEKHKTRALIEINRNESKHAKKGTHILYYFVYMRIYTFGVFQLSHVQCTMYNVTMCKTKIEKKKRKFTKYEKL